MADAERTVACAFCGERMPRDAEQCRFCGEDQFEDVRRPRARPRSEGDEVVRWLIPIDRSGWAIASGYCGLLACFPLIGLLFGVIGIVTGILALAHTKRNPRLAGQGRALFGIIMGSIAGLGNAVLVVLLIAGTFK